MVISSSGRYDASFFDYSPNHSGAINPQFIVMHYTATWSADSAINTFRSPSSKVSAHFVIDRDGEITQMVPTNKKAWHAGPSRWKGYTGLNSYSIGIEFVNIGFLKALGDDKALDPYGRVRNLKALPMLGEPTFFGAPQPRIGSGIYLWPTYTEEQLDAGDHLVSAILDKYDIQAILSHEEIDTRGWKTDPGPAFPMERYRTKLDREDDDHPVYSVTARPYLNLRGGPGTGFEVLNKLNTGTKVRVKGEQGNWALVEHFVNPTVEGWVHTAYLQRTN